MKTKTIHSLYYHNPSPEGVEKMVRYHLQCACLHLRRHGTAR